MDIKEIKAKLSALTGDEGRKRKLIVFIGIAGMLLILISELIPDSKKQTKVSTNTEQDELYDTRYKLELETELCDILKQIKGVGETQIMLTLDGTTEYVYAEELDTLNDTNDTSKRESYKSKLVITDSAGEKKALVKKVIRPQVTGVIVACAGGDDVNIKEQVISAVSAVLGIPAGRICVLKLEK